MADDNQHPPLPIAVELAPRLLARAESTEGLLDEVRRSIAAGVGDLMARLGVPGEPVVTLSAIAGGSSQSQFLRLSVGGTLCRYPDRLLARVYSFLTATPLQPPDLDGIAGWLEGPVEAGETDRLARFLGTACRAIVALDSSCLLGREQLDAYLGTLPGRPGPDRQAHRPVCRRRQLAGRDRRGAYCCAAPAGDCDHPPSGIPAAASDSPARRKPIHPDARRPVL